MEKHGDQSYCDNDSDYDDVDVYNDTDYLYLVALNGKVVEGLLQHLLMKDISSHGPSLKIGSYSLFKGWQATEEFLRRYLLL